jgi:DNA-binding MarR family transcriptional regulator
MRKKPKPQAAAFDPVDCLASIFTTRRDLLEPLRQEVLREDAPVTVDEADALIYLWGAAELGWTAPPADEEGFVAVSDLRSALVHDRGLFSRQIQKLQQNGFIEGKQPSERRGTRRYVNAVRIAEAGIKVVRPIWERYRLLASKLLAGIPQGKLKAHFEVNEEISKRIRAKRDGLSDLYSKHP